MRSYAFDGDFHLSPAPKVPHVLLRNYIEVQQTHTRIHVYEATRKPVSKKCHAEKDPFKQRSNPSAKLHNATYKFLGSENEQWQRHCVVFVSFSPFAMVHMMVLVVVDGC